MHRLLSRGNCHHRKTAGGRGRRKFELSSSKPRLRLGRAGRPRGGHREAIVRERQMAEGWDSNPIARRWRASPIDVGSDRLSSGAARSYPCREGWRRGWDSNPRNARTLNGFQDRRNRPLCHPSGRAEIPAQLRRTRLITRPPEIARDPPDTVNEPLIFAAYCRMRPFSV